MSCMARGAGSRGGICTHLADGAVEVGWDEGRDVAQRAVAEAGPAARSFADCDEDCCEAQALAEHLSAPVVFTSGE